MTLSTGFKLAERMASKGSCRACGETAPPAMTHDGICYECRARRNDRKASEEHHVLGRSHSLTIELPGNIHRQWSARAECRPVILKQPSDNPLVEIARIVTTIAEIAETGADCARRQALSDWLAMLGDIIAKLCRRAADNLLILAQRIADHNGPHWHCGAELLPWH